jgi:hypothetical protein
MRVYCGGHAEAVAGANAERVNFSVSLVVGASEASGGGSSEENPSIRQRTIMSSWQARERIRSPKNATLVQLARFSVNN